MQSHVSQALDHRGVVSDFFLQSPFFAVMTAHLLTLAVASWQYAPAYIACFTCVCV